MNFTIVVPTYNEAENIKNTIEGLVGEFEKLKNHQGSILVVDDNSPDGTGDIVKKLQASHKNLYLVSGEKNGLGDAYKRGFAYALDKLKAEAVFEYDADGQHSPKFIPHFLEALDGGADVAVGSRYIKGGSIPSEWGFKRKVISYLGNLACRIVLLTPQYHDMTTGFRATKADYLKRINTNWIYKKGFSYKIELYFQLHKLGAKIKEVPIEFLERDKGESKIAGAEAARSLKVIFTLRYREWEKFLKVCVVGGIGMLVDVGFFNLFRLFLPPQVATVFSTELAIVSNFVINNIWTFEREKIPFSNIKLLGSKFLQFNLVSLGSVLIQFVVMTLGVKFLGRGFLVENSLKLVGILIGLAWNFVMYTKVIWHGDKKS